MNLTVARFAERTGLTPDAVRYYEREGLLPAVKRSRAGYRLFDEALVERCRLIKGARRAGVKLRAIRELLTVMDRGACPCHPADMILRARLVEIDREMAELREARAWIAKVSSDLSPGVAEMPAGGWPCERAFIEAGTTGGNS